MTEKKRPRVLMLTSTLPRWEGDTEPRFVLDLARHLSEYFDIELLAPHTCGSVRYEVLEGVPVTRFRYWLPRWQSVAYEGGISWRLRANPLRLFQVPFFMLSMAWHVVRRLRRNPKIDLIHAHWLIPQGLVAILVRRLAGRHIPLITTSHGGDMFGLGGWFWHALKKKVLQESDAVTVVSNAMIDVAKEISDNIDPLVIPMGTDLRNRFVPPPTPRTPGRKNLIFVGRLVKNKGVEYLLQALALVVDKHPEAHLKIVGDGSLDSYLEELAKQLRLDPFVTFVGALPHDQLPSYFQNSDVAIFPSNKQEGFGLVVVEAMGTECGIVASRLPAVNDTVRDGETGLLVTPGSPSELADALDNLLSNPRLLISLGRRSRVVALQYFDWSVSANKFKDAYQSVLTI